VDGASALLFAIELDYRLPLRGPKENRASAVYGEQTLANPTAEAR
jgi:hypothetical protein